MIKLVPEKLFDHMVRIRRQIHRHPELAYKEHTTAALIEGELKRLGIEVTTGIGGTGMVGRIDSPNGSGPVVALRADMDAVAIGEATGLEFASENPGIMHACGHDGHMAMLLGAAALLKESLETGTVLLIFQPAEEGGAGALKILESGLLEGVEAIFGCHLDRHFKVGEAVAQEGAISAFTDRFEISIQGKGGHAAQPHDAVDAIVVASLIVMSLQTIVSRETNPAHPLIVSVGKFEGGSIPNAIADSAKMLGTIRSTELHVREQVIAGIKRIGSAAGLLHDAQVEVKITGGYPSVINAKDETGIAQSVLRSLLGDSAVTDSGYINMGGEDFSFYLQKIPGCFVRIGAQKEGLENVPAHSAHFDIDERALAVGAAYLAKVAKTAIESLSK
ncbi:MAG: M20 family metallopeptidase [Thermodesulfobacteriota bacterium]